MILQILDSGSYALTPYALPMLVIGTATVIQGLFIFVRERGSRIGVLFLLMCLSVSLYFFGAGVSYASRGDGLGLFWIRISQIGAVFIPCTTFMLTTALLGLIPRLRLASAAAVALSALFALGVLFTGLHVRGAAAFPWGRFVHYGLLGFAFVCYFIGIMVLNLYLYWREYPRSTTARQKKRLKNLLIAFSVGYFGAVDFLPAIGIPVYPCGYIPVFFFIMMSTYVVLRYRLVDITPELAAEQILETMRGAVIVVDLESRIRVISRVAQQMLGYEKSELLGRRLASILPALSEPARDASAGEHAFPRQMTWRARNGNLFEVVVSVSSITDQRDGSALGIVYVAHDVTERIKVEEALRQKEVHLRGVLDSTADGILAVDSAGRTISTNRRFAELWNIPQPLLDGGDDQTLLDYVLDQLCDPAGFLDKVKSLYGTDQVDNDTLFFKDGRVFDRYSAPLTHQGALIGRVWSFRNITDRIRTEQALRESKEFVTSILNTVDEGFIVVDLDYRILTANRAYCEQVGLPAHAVTGKRCFEVSHRQSRPCHEVGEHCSVRSVLATGGPQTAFHRHIGADGNVIFVETRAFPLRDAAGNITSVIESINNITEKHLLEEERLKTQKLEAIGTLAGGIAHDFNNLLQGIFGYISLARLNAGNRENRIEALEQAEKALHQAVSLTNQLLTFSKGGKPVKKLIDLRPVIENAAKFALSGSRSDYRITADADLWLTEADEGQIGQVIQNIVLNADQAMPEGGRVEITARNRAAGDRDLPQKLQRGDYVEIAIKDTGIGIPQQYINRIFDPYFTTKERGSGLGLATSYSIIRNHSGLVDVESEPGKRSIFFVYLPAVPGKQKGTGSETRTAAGNLRSAKILVMDDEELIRSVAEKMIKVLGHSAECVTNGEAAIERYLKAKEEAKPFDLVILDLTVREGMGGAAACERLLAIDPGVKVVVSSGYSDDSVASEHQEHGFKAFLKKPYNISTLRELLSKVLE